MADVSRSTIGTVKSWDTSQSKRTTNDSDSSSNGRVNGIEDTGVRRSYGNPSTEEFPWLSQDNIEPIKTRYTASNPPQWFREASVVPERGRTLRRGDPRANAAPLAQPTRESIVDLHLIVSDLDYYAGAVHDFQSADRNEEEKAWDEEKRQGQRPSPQRSDGTSFGSIEILRGGAIKHGISAESRKYEEDANLVTWDGPSDPFDPKNWSNRKKWMATLTVSLFTFISPVSSSMVAPALGQIMNEFNTSNATAALALSAFVLGFAVGPLFLGPLSELFGRRIVLQCSNIFYFAFNLACGFSSNIGEIVAFRFLSGLGGSAPLGIGGGVLGDIWLPQERGKAMALYSLMPLLGPAIGPIVGGFIAEYTTWRWVFWSTSIAAIFVQALGLFALQETYAATILESKKKQLIKFTGNRDLHTEYDTPNRSFSSHIGTAFKRPFKLLFTQPIVQVLSLYIGFVYGALYLVLATFPRLWHSPEYYNEDISIAGLNYISLGLGFFIGTQIAAIAADRIYKRLKAKNNNAGRSEFRVPLLFPGAVMIPIGLVLYGWSAQYRLFWLVPNIGAAIFAAGNQLVFQNSQTYIVDAYTRYAASAIAATTLFRSLGGFAFPLFADAMYDALGWGWGNTVLAFAAVAIGIPVPFILWWYGESLRKRNWFASGG